MFSFFRDNAILKCSLGGEFDTQESIKLKNELKTQIDDNKPSSIIFDVHNVKYVCSTFLSVCLETYKNFGAQNFSVLNMTPHVKKVFKIAGLDNTMLRGKQ